MKLYLTKQIQEPKFFLTFFKPRVHRVKGTLRDSLYLEIGEPIGVLGLCLEGVLTLFGQEVLQIKDGESIQVNLQGEVLHDNKSQ